MFTNFDNCFLCILQQFITGRLLTDDDFYEILGDKILGFRFSLGGTIGEFLEGLADDNYLKRVRKRYKITEKGKKRLGKLLRKAGLVVSSRQ